MQYDIIIPFDFSEHAVASLKTASAFCNEVDAIAHLVYVIAQENSERDLERLSQVTQELKCKAKPVVIQGAVATKILEYADQQANPVILLSCLSNDGKPCYRGPVAHYLLANAACPVLMLKADLDIKKISAILLPINLDEENKKKISYAIFLSEFFNNALLRLLTVVYDLDDYSLHKQMLRMNRTLQFFQKAGVNAVGEVVRCYSEDGESYSKVAVDYAQRSDAELILLMTEDEKAKPGSGISKDTDYMLTHFRNNILSITPFVKQRAGR